MDANIADIAITGNLGFRIRELRKWLRLSQEAVASFVGLPRTALTAIEAQRREVSVDELVKLCCLFHCEPNILLGLALPPTSALRMKCNMRLNAEAGGIDHSDHRELETFAQFLKRNDGCNKKLPDYSSASPEEAALRLSEQLRLTVPVDIFAAVTQLGIYLRFTSLGKLSGATLKEVDGTRVLGIIVNSDQPDDRIRFSVAHELGHLLLAHHPNEPQIVSLKGRHFDPVEKEADSFAAEILAPAHSVRSKAEEIKASGGKISAEAAYALSCEYSVSYHAMIVRLRMLDCISESEYELHQQAKPSAIREKMDTNVGGQVADFDPAILDEIVHQLSSYEVTPKIRKTPDWIRILQEAAYARYLTKTPVGTRLEVRRVYETVALWAANHDPLLFS